MGISLFWISPQALHHPWKRACDWLIRGQRCRHTIQTRMDIIAVSTMSKAVLFVRHKIVISGKYGFNFRNKRIMYSYILFYRIISANTQTETKQDIWHISERSRVKCFRPPAILLAKMICDHLHVAFRRNQENYYLTVREFIQACLHEN